MKNIALTILACVLATCAFAAWSTDPANPNLIAGFPGEQSIPKVAVTAMGNSYVSRFDNNGGSYKVYLQLFAADGEPLWTDPNGLLVSDHNQMSWLTDYDMDVDNDGNAVIVFQDIRNAGANNVVAYKISPTGEFLWSADGIALSSDTSTFSNMAPVVFNSNDNSTYVAWQRYSDTANTSIVMNRISDTGQKLWGENGITIGVFDGDLTWPQIIQSDAESILLKYYYDTGNFPGVTRRLKVDKYNAGGILIWGSVMTDAGGYNVWQQTIPFKPDGTGGAILAWYDDRENDWDYDVYCQRVDVNGQTTMGEDGTLITVDPANQQFYPKLAIDPVNQNIFAFFRVTDANQNLAGLGRQLLNYSGTRLWGDTAPLILPIGDAATDCSAAYYTQAGAVCVYRHGLDNVYATNWLASGNSGWAADSPVALTAAPKDDVVIDKHSDDWIVVSWSQGSTDYDICAMRLNSNGSLGQEFAAPRNLTATLIPPDGVQLDWLAPSQTAVPDSYYVYMNDELAQVVAGNILSYQILNLSPGTHQFYVKARYGDNYSAPSNTATVLIVAANDPELPPVQPLLSVFPNPFKGTASLRLVVKDLPDIYRLSVFDIKGRMLFHKDITPILGEQILQINPETMHLTNSGVYCFRLETGDEIQTVKAVLIK